MAIGTRKLAIKQHRGIAAWSARLVFLTRHKAVARQPSLNDLKIHCASARRTMAISDPAKVMNLAQMGIVFIAITNPSATWL